MATWLSHHTFYRYPNTVWEHLTSSQIADLLADCFVAIASYVKQEAPKNPYECLRVIPWILSEPSHWQGIGTPGANPPTAIDAEVVAAVHAGITIINDAMRPLSSLTARAIWNAYDITKMVIMYPQKDWALLQIKPSTGHILGLSFDTLIDDQLVWAQITVREDITRRPRYRWGRIVRASRLSEQARTVLKLTRLYLSANAGLGWALHQIEQSPVCSEYQLRKWRRCIVRKTGYALHTSN